MDKIIKLLVITDEMEVGGTQRQITRMLTNLDTAKFESTLIYFRNKSFLVDELSSNGITVIHVEKHSKLDIQFAYRLFKEIKKGEFDIVHAFSFSGELWGTIAALMAGVDTIFTSIRGTYEWYSMPQWWLKQWISNRSSCVIANSKAGADYAKSKMNVMASRFSVIYNGITMPSRLSREKIEDKKQTIATNSIDFTIGFIGRLVEHKNIYCLLRSLPLLSQALSIKVIIVGDGPLMSALKNEARLITDIPIAFLGERSDVAELIQTFDCVVQPSFREGLSNTILEAMILGVPVIASDVGGNPELITNNQEGFLFPNDDHQALASSLNKIISNSQLKETLSKNAITTAENRFSVANMVQQMSNIYSKHVTVNNE